MRHRGRRQRARALRTVFAELERLRHHAAVITGICNSTALAVATSQAALIEEDLLRLSCEVGRHRYLFGLVEPGGLSRDLSDEHCRHLAATVRGIARRLRDLHQMLRYSSSFLDRLEEVGIVSAGNATSYGLYGPIARASGVARDIRKALSLRGIWVRRLLAVPVEEEGDGYARLRVFFQRGGAVGRHHRVKSLQRCPEARFSATVRSGGPVPRSALSRPRRAPPSTG